MTVKDIYTFMSCRIELFSNNIKIGNATGFFYKKKNKLFLVSNWHVFSGRNAYTGQPINKDCAIPDRIIAYYWIQFADGQYKLLTINLKIVHGEVNIWMQHDLGQDVDVAIIQLDEYIYKDLLTYPNDHESSYMQVMVSMDCFIIGFPLGISVANHLPVWKRASIASEPDVLIDGLNLMIVDSATREGMSGSPVILRSHSGYVSEDGSMVLNSSTSSKFLGVYSGRYVSKDEFGAQLGRVWKRKMIDEIIDNPCIGSYELRKL